jgi:uncharacterized RDD family membrane protein YckC
MMNDTVREELQTKITTGVPQQNVRKPEPPTPEPPKIEPAPPRPPILAQPPIRRVQTADLSAPKTSPTLVGFQNKNAPLPEWRLQMQNAVQQRKNGGAPSAATATQFRTEGSAAIKAEPSPPPSASVAQIADERVANAMKRIAESREAFLKPQAGQKKTTRSVPNPVQKPFPFDVVPAKPSMQTATAAAPARIAPPKPRLVASPPLVAEKRDTNKLPPLETVKEPVIARVEALEVTDEPYLPATEFAAAKRISIRAEQVEKEVEADIEIDEEIEDLAPFSMRFGAGLFDLIIGAFGGLLLISPIAFSTEDWFTPAGMLMFAAAWGVVLFLYMTVCLGLFGKTLGMRLFSLELVDAVENEYPTLRQAAVNSAVFMLLLPLAGVGFLPAIFNEENRALHDLLSGTIQVKEF